MKNTNRKGRAALKKQKGAGIRGQAQEGNRDRDAFWAMSFLDKVSKTPRGKTASLENWLLGLLTKAWKSKNEKFFKDIARTINRSKRKYDADDVHADPAAAALLAYVLECPPEELSRDYSVHEIQKICARCRPVSARSAVRLARAAGLKIRRKGAPKKSAHPI